MGVFGERLRRERELRHISLAEIAATTKIGTRLLSALEDEQFDQLPGGIFNKGYVRAYARYVGIDEEQAVADYLQAIHQNPNDVHSATGSPNRVDNISRQQSAAAEQSRFPIVPVLIVLALIAGVAGGWRIYRERQVDRAAAIGKASSETLKESGARVTASSIPAAPVSSSQSSSGATKDGQVAGPTGREGSARQQTVAGSGTAVSNRENGISGTLPTRNSDQQVTPAGTTASQNVATPGSGVPFELTVRAKDRAWVSIESDGKFVVRGIIKPPDVKIIHATNQLVFYTGNAGDVDVSFNGKNVPVSGGENDERVLVFNSHGLLPQSASQ
jgi:cytoskeleton protein RodZ